MILEVASSYLEKDSMRGGGTNTPDTPKLKKKPGKARKIPPQLRRTVSETNLEILNAGIII